MMMVLVLRAAVGWRWIGLSTIVDLTMLMFVRSVSEMGLEEGHAPGGREGSTGVGRGELEGDKKKHFEHLCQTWVTREKRGSF